MAAVGGWLREADLLEAAGDIDVALTRLDALGGERDRLQARRAEPVDGHAGHGHRAAGAQRDLAGDVAAGGAFRRRAAHDHILDLLGVDLGAAHGMADNVAAHGGAVGVVEGTTERFGEARSGGRDDDGITHGGGSSG